MADLQLWLKYAMITAYAGDTSSSVSHKLLSKVKSMLEEDAFIVLKFMATNGLVANASKTVFLLLNLKKQTELNPVTIKIGDVF